MTTQAERDDDGYYHVSGHSLPSVTTIIGDQLPQDGLERWKENTPNWREVRDRAAFVGTVAHRRVLQQYARRNLPIETVPAKYRTDDVQTDVEVAEALWDSVKDDIPIGENPYVEETLWKADPGYAGSADMIADPDNSEAFVMDLKTSSSLQRSHELQISAYAYAARERGVADVQRAAIIKLNYREPAAGVKWIDSDRLADLYDEFCELVEGFHAQQRLG